VSVEVPVSAAIIRKGGASATEGGPGGRRDTGRGELRTRGLYAFNAQTTVHSPATDGSRVVTQRKYLVPTEEAYASLAQYSVLDFPAGAPLGFAKLGL
jgi:hypothetical protein